MPSNGNVTGDSFHEASADGSSWEDVILRLEREGGCGRRGSNPSDLLRR